jgi:hypothetical protein
MTKRLSLVLVAASLLAASSLAAPAFAGDPPPATASPSDASIDSRVTPPPAGQGQVVFFRPNAPGFLLSFSVHEGDKGIVKLGSGTYSVVPIAPGSHTFMIESEAEDTLTIEVEAGETYYVRQTMGMGLIVGHPHLNLSDQDAFIRVRSLKLTTLKATDKAGADKPASTDATK